MLALLLVRTVGGPQVHGKTELLRGKSWFLLTAKVNLLTAKFNFFTANLNFFTTKLNSFTSFMPCLARIRQIGLPILRLQTDITKMAAVR